MQDDSEIAARLYHVEARITFVNGSYMDVPFNVKAMTKTM